MRTVYLLCVMFVPEEPGGRQSHDLCLIDSTRDCGTVARVISPLSRDIHHFKALLAVNVDYDLMFNDWKTIMTSILKYCENVPGQ